MKKSSKIGWSRFGIVLLAALCLGVLAFDFFSTNIHGSLPAEAPVAGMVLNPQIVPEPEATETFGSKTSAQNQEQPAEDEFYAEYRLQREQVRAEELEMLQSIIDDEFAGQELRDTAGSRKLQIAQNMEYELMTENVLYAKNFGQTVVMLGRDKVTVVLSGLFDDIRAAQVADTVSGITGFSYENIIIINR